MRKDITLGRELVALAMAQCSRVRHAAFEGDLESVQEAARELAGYLDSLESLVGVSTPQALFAD